MIKTSPFLFFFVVMTWPIFCKDIEDVKTAITIQLERVAQASVEEKGPAMEELALLYLQDQDQERAFATFLEALDQTKSNRQPECYDTIEYKKAFAIYLDSSAKSPQEIAKNLLDGVLPVLKIKPEEPLLHYFLAIAYANLAKYEPFFHHFYTAYQHYPCHYLAYKIKAILHVKLLERTGNEAERNFQRQKIVDNLQIASNLEPLDTTIYKLLISFSSKENKKEQARLSLNKIINGNIMIPRSELMFYVIEAVDVEEKELAQQFILRAKEWYPQSRMVTAAESYLKRES